MDRQMREDISCNDNNNNSSNRFSNNDISSFSGKKYDNYNAYMDQNNDDISSNLDDLGNDDSNGGKEVRFMIVNNPLLELYRSKEAIIKIEYNECCCCNEYNNIYNVFTKVNNKNNIFKYLFQGKEFISCKDYSCCDYCENPFTLGINKVVKTYPDVKARPFGKIEKACSFTCFCFGRPEATIKVNYDNKILGRISIPCSVGNTTYHIYNSKNKLKYIIDADYCQVGIICMKNICGCLPEVFFEIYEPKDSGQQIVGTIQRIPGKYESFMHVLDCDQIMFPNNSTGEERFLLICGVFMIEYQIFRNKSGNLECCACGCETYSEGETCFQECLRHSCVGCCGLFRF